MLIKADASHTCGVADVRFFSNSNPAAGTGCLFPFSVLALLTGHLFLFLLGLICYKLQTLQTTKCVSLYLVEIYNRTVPDSPSVSHGGINNHRP